MSTCHKKRFIKNLFYALKRWFSTWYSFVVEYGLDNASFISIPGGATTTDDSHVEFFISLNWVESTDTHSPGDCVFGSAIKYCFVPASSFTPNIAM